MNADLGWSKEGRARNLIKVDNISICEAMSGKTQNHVYNWIMGMTGKSLKRKIHPCPYVVRILA